MSEKTSPANLAYFLACSRATTRGISLLALAKIARGLGVPLAALVSTE